MYELFMNLSKYKVFYDLNGYVVIKNLVKESTLNKILEEIEILEKKVVNLKNKKYFHKTNKGKFNSIHNIQEFIKSGNIINFTKNSKLKKIVKVLLQKQPKLRNVEFFLKPAKNGMAAPFHQDNFYWNIINSEALNVWLACSSANKKNGGVCYLQGSHELGTINHSLSFAKGTSQKIPDKILKKLNFKKIFPNLKKGDCVIHHPEIIHGSSKNISERDRIGLAVSYASTNSKIDKLKLKKYIDSLKKSLNIIYK